MLKSTLMAAVLTLGVFVGPAFADYPPAEPPPDVDVIDEVDEVDEVEEVDRPPTDVSDLPVTGADVAGLSAFGAVLLGLGALALRRRDRSEKN